MGNSSRGDMRARRDGGDTAAAVLEGTRSVSAGSRRDGAAFAVEESEEAAVRLIHGCDC